MLFNYAQVFCYDADRLKKFKFADVMRTYLNPNDSPSGLALSGLPDLVETLLITEEYYTRNYPRLDFKEIRKGGGVSPTFIDPLYNEPQSLKKEYSRVVKVPSFISLSDKETKLSKQGAQVTQTAEFCVGTYLLYKLDYYPEIGDEILYMGELYQIGEVVVKKNHYHALTGFPIHVSLKTINIQHGDEQMPVSLLSTNQVVNVQPNNVPPKPSGPPDGRVR